jgi:predicted nuclease of predicted toxin-antitoxin system
MNLVADESVDFGIIQGLRKKGINVFSIAEESGGIKDTEVLKVAVKNDALLITEDKDFGELAFRLKFQHKGILLIRLSDLPRNERLLLAVKTIFLNLNKLARNFSVLTKNGLRIKNLKREVK